MTDLVMESTDLFDKDLIFDLDEVGRRIRAVRGRYNLSQSDFAAGLYISRKWLSELENGKKCPSGLLLLGLQCRYAISRDWILGGKGSMLLSSEIGKRGQDNAEALRFLHLFSKLSQKSREKILDILNTFSFIEENHHKPPELDS